MILFHLCIYFSFFTSKELNKTIQLLYNEIRYNNCKKNIAKNESKNTAVKKCIENIFKIEDTSHFLVVKNCTHKIDS